MTSLVPANDLAEERLQQPRLVGDGVLADVDAFLQGQLNDGRHLAAIRYTAERKGLNLSATFRSSFQIGKLNSGSIASIIKLLTRAASLGLFLIKYFITPFAPCCNTVL